MGASLVEHGNLRSRSSSGWSVSFLPRPDPAPFGRRHGGPWRELKSCSSGCHETAPARGSPRGRRPAGRRPRRRHPRSARQHDDGHSARAAGPARLAGTGPGQQRPTDDRSPPGSATSRGSPRPRSSPGTPGCARSSASRAAGTTAARSPRTAPSTCAGRSSRRPPMPPGTRRTRSGTSAPSSGSVVSAGPRSPGSTSPASSPPPSGTCSPSVRRSAPAGPTWLLWSL